MSLIQLNKTLLFSLCLGLASTSAASQVDYGFNTSGFYSDYRGEPDVNLSSLWMEYNSQALGEASLPEVLGEDALWTVKVTLSSLPGFLKGMAKEDVMERAEPRFQAYADAIIAQNPALAGLPPVYLAAARDEILNQIRAQAEPGIDERIAEVESELTFQEVIIGRTTCEQKSCRYVKFGKSYVGNSSLRDSDISIWPDRSQRASETVGTTFVKFGSQTELQGTKFTAEFILFKSRAAFYTGRDYLASIVNLDEAQYASSRDLDDFDSILILSEHRSDNYVLGISLSHVSTYESEHTPEFSMQWRYHLDESTQVEFTYFYADTNLRAGVEQSLTLAAERKLTERFSVGSSVTLAKGYNDPYTTEVERMNYSRTEINAGWTAIDSEHCLLRMKVGFEKYSGDLKGEGPMAAAQGRCYFRRR